MLKTDRLLLRQWKRSDYSGFAKISGDTDVMEFYPKLLTVVESDALADRIRGLIDKRGWGFWAVETLKQKDFIGFVGLHIPSEQLPFSPCVEIGWRIAKEHWGKGYATEAAQAALDYGFSRLDLDEIVSFTTLANLRSQRVMQKIGMSDAKENFMHPDIDRSHPQCEHVLYKLTQSDWFVREQLNND
jgi:RimJ/RimL family protein N-acetyltransferase